MSLVLLFVLLAADGSISPAHSAGFTVDSTTDAVDANSGYSPSAEASAGSTIVSSLSIQSATVEQGADVTVALNAAASSPGLGTFDVKVGFDAAKLAFKDCTGHPSGLCNKPADGEVRFVGASASGLSGSLELGTVTFTAGIDEGTTDLHISTFYLTDPEGANLTVTPGDGTITILATMPQDTPPHVLGDTNCDESVDAIDALQVLRSVASIRPEADCIPVGDVNCDWDLEATDALRILRHVAGLTPSLAGGTCPAIGYNSVHLLTIDKFGPGTVTSNSPAIHCGTGCTTRSVPVASNTPVTLHAATDGSGTISNWTGCDQAVGPSCDLIVNGDEIVFAMFEQEVTFRDGVVVLSEDSMQHLKGKSGGTYRFDGAADQAASLSPGQVIVSFTHGGIIGRVEHVEFDAGDIIVTTTEAALPDAVASGTLVVGGTLGSPSQPGALAIPSSDCSVAPIQIPVNVDTDKFKLSGKACISGTLDAALQTDFQGLKELKFIPTLYIRDEGITLFIKYPLPSYKTTFPLGSYKLPCVSVICPELEPELTLTLSAAAGGEVKVSLDLQITGGFHWVRGDVLPKIITNAKVLGGDFKMSPTVKVGAKLQLGVQLETLLFGAAGPSLTVGPYFRADVDILRRPAGQLFIGFGAGAAGVTLQVPVLGRELEFAVDLDYGVEWLWLNSDPPPVNTDLAVRSADISWSPQLPTLGQSVTIKAKIRNIGNANSAGVHVQFSSDVGIFCVTDPCDGVSPFADAFVDVPTGGTITVQVTLPSIDRDPTVKVVIDPDNLISESREDNNSASVTISAAWPVPPAAPTGVLDEYLGLDTNMFRLHWTDRSINEEGFRIYGRSCDLNGGCESWSLVTTVGSGQTSWDHEPYFGIPEISVEYAVSAFNSAGESPLIPATLLWGDGANRRRLRNLRQSQPEMAEVANTSMRSMS